MFSIVVSRKQEDDDSDKQSGGGYEIADIKADLLLNVDHQQIGHTAANVDEPVEPVEERVNGLFTEPLHLPQQPSDQSWKMASKT